MPQPYRILLVNSLLARGGTERQVAVVAQSLNPKRFQVSVAAMRTGGFREAELREHGIPIDYYPVTSFKSPSAITIGRRLGRYIRDNQVDLVHCFDVPACVFATPFARWAQTGNPKRPVILTSQRAHRGLTPGMTTRLLRLMDHLTQGIVVNCDAMRQHLIQDEGVAASLIHLSYNAIDVANFCPGTPAPDLPEAELTIGVICVQRSEKGLETLIDGFAQIAHLRPGLKLALVGDGPIRQDLVNLARERGLENQVAFLPQTANVEPYYRGMDIFVLPSLSEALSNSLMEACASGCCPVASRVGGNPEIIADRETGLLFPPGDATALAQCLRQLIENPEQRQSFARAARQRMVDRFSTEASIARMEEIYLSFLQARR